MVIVSSSVFLQRLNRRSQRPANNAPHLYAKRFAAKEACSKALGTGLSNGVFWRDMGVVNTPSGKPTMKLTGGAAEQLQRLLPHGKRAAIHLTITDDFSSRRPS